MNSMTPTNETHYALDSPRNRKMGTMLGAVRSYVEVGHARGLNTEGPEGQPENRGAENITIKHVH